ncbi:efflux RND transporter periplasmic adaptor subunit [Planctomycetota bacterium]
MLLAGGGIGLWAYGRPGRKGLSSAETEARVVRRDFVSTVLATGAVKAQVGAEVRVGARISGKVERLHVNIGDVVTSGQVIAVLEKGDLEATVRQREAELTEARHRLAAERREGPLKVRHAKSRLAEAEAERDVALTRLRAVEQERRVQVEVARAECKRWAATLQLAVARLERLRRLREEKVVSEDELDEAEEAKATAAAQLEVAQRKLDLAEIQEQEDTRQAQAVLAETRASCSVAEQALALEEVAHEERLKELEAAVGCSRAVLDHAQVQLSYATITAPIAGVIGAVTTQEGETVAAGLNAPTFVSVIDLDRLQVDAFVDEVDIGKVRTGQDVAFTVDAFPAREFEGRVAAIYPKAVLQDNVVYYVTEVEITSPYRGALRPEMTANVTISLEARTDVLAVPAKAIKRLHGKNIVYVVKGGQPVEREIRTGWREGPWIEVGAGLSEGEAVLLRSPDQDMANREGGP